MKLARVEVRRRSLTAERTGYVVIAEDERGLAGLGEAAPIPGYAPDDATTVGASLLAAATALEGTSLEDSVAAVEAMLAGPGLELDASPAARCALETALLDLVARRVGASLHELLGDASNVGRTVRRSGLLPRGLTGDALIAAANAASARGLQTLKVKIDPSFVREHFTDLRRLRTAFDGELRFDANGTFGAEAAGPLLERLAELAPEIVEEPTRGRALLDLGVAACAWAADESLADATLADAFVESASCAGVVLKPGLLGGLLRARAIAERAQARGLAVIVTHALDGPISLAAACELALSLPDPPLACGLDPHPLLSLWPACPVAQLDEPGHVVAADALGIAIDQAYFDEGRW